MLAVILTHDLIYCLKNNSNIEQNDHLNNAVATQYCPFIMDTNTVPSSSIPLLHGARHKPFRSLDFLLDLKLRAGVHGAFYCHTW